MRGDPRHVPALTCLLVPQTNGMVQCMQLYWAAVNCVPTPAVPLMLPDARPAAPRSRDHDEAYMRVPGELVHMPVLDSYGVQQSEDGLQAAGISTYGLGPQAGLPARAATCTRAARFVPVRRVRLRAARAHAPRTARTAS